jgi:hypothetical protein
VTQAKGDHCNPAIAVDGAGVMYVAWQENVCGTWAVCTSVSLDGKLWSTPKPVAQAASNQDVYMATSTDAFMTVEVSAVTSDESDQTDPVISIDTAFRMSA